MHIQAMTLGEVSIIQQHFKLEKTGKLSCFQVA